MIIIDLPNNTFYCFCCAHFYSEINPANKGTSAFRFFCSRIECYPIEQLIIIIVIITTTVIIIGDNCPKGWCQRSTPIGFIEVECLFFSRGKNYRYCLDENRQLIQHLVNEYLLEGSSNILHLIRNCPNEYFEVNSSSFDHFEFFIYLISRHWSISFGIQHLKQSIVLKMI